MGWGQGVHNISTFKKIILFVGKKMFIKEISLDSNNVFDFWIEEEQITPKMKGNQSQDHFTSNLAK